MTKRIRHHVRSNCPNEQCGITILIGGCDTAEEAVEASQAAIRIHYKHSHPETEDEPTFNVIASTDEATPASKRPKRLN